MAQDINNFVSIVRQKNGKIKIMHDIHNEANIYKYLRELGFCKSKLDSKRIFYQRKASEIIPTNLDGIKTTFWNLLQSANFENIPSDIDYSYILNWFLTKNPIKENVFFDHYLEDNLTEIEIFNYKLLTDSTFRHEFEIETLLSKFQEWTFKKTVDVASGICKDCPLYYKNIGNNNYLIFSHYNSKDKRVNDGFDSWIATYSNESQIGNKKPVNLETIRLSFQLDKDFSLISKYLN